MRMGSALKQYSVSEENKVKEFWKKKGIAAKARAKNAGSGKRYYFMDGPPYATGHIHMGTALNKILKDVALRSRRMQGFDVFDRPGYDTHGLPIENSVEKKLGFREKQDIEKYGVEKFVEECREYATRFIDTMSSEFEDLGVWMDWENPYLTLRNDYIEAIWWTFKKAEEKGLLYLGKYSVHVCPHCATAVAYNEIEYIKQTDESVYVKFPAKGMKGTHFVIWTTTPWTLPANTGIMVHPRFSYAFVKMSSGETWIVAEEKVQELMDVLEAGYTIEKKVKGKELGGMEYENPLGKNLAFPPSDLKGAYRVVLSERYVNLEEGTGLVHTAPGHGREDFEVGLKEGLPALSPVSLDGKMTKEAGKYAGKTARMVDAEIVSDLEKSGHLVYRHPYTHDYPVCWRCKSPLLMISTPQWFFRVSSIQKKLISENKKVNWVPEWMQARMHNWLESLSDWPVSRNRYWGTPLPIWQCSKCDKKEVFGSLEELEKKAGVQKNLDLHKPYIDKVEYQCGCGGKMSRVPEVLDVWFDSGVSSWAALGYPGEKELFEKFWPADLNLEGTDQFRGWWNSEIITSVICFGKAPYKNIVTHGMVLDVNKKEKMSKSRGNIVTPQEVIQKYSRDYLRYYIVQNSKGDDMYFDWQLFKGIKRFFNIFWNSFNYASLYLDLDFGRAGIRGKKLKPEDRWILSRANSLSKKALSAYNSYKFYEVIAALEEFVLEDLSRTYIKIVRDRIGSEKDTLGAVMNHVLLDLLKIAAPIVPHMAEFVYREFKGALKEESVHMLSLPEPSEKLADKKLEKEMNAVVEAVQAVLSLREEHSLRRRWPLESVVIVSKSGKILPELGGVLATLCNVREVKESKKKPEGKFASKKLAEAEVFLETARSPELKEEAEFRELVRKVQSMRKEAGLTPGEKVKLNISCSDAGFLEKFSKKLEAETNTALQQKEGKKEKLLERAFFLELRK